MAPDGVPETSPVQPTIYKTKETSPLHSCLTALLFLGFIHFTFYLILFSFFLSFSKSLLVYGFLLILAVIPVDPNSQWGRNLARYICKHFYGYFPLTLYVEDINAFTPDQAYVFGYEPHSVFPISFVALVDLTGFMTLPKIKVLATSAVAFLRARRGFVQIAMEKGCPIVPVFCFGQTDTYKWWKPGGELIVKLARAIKVQPIVFWGRYGAEDQKIHVNIFRFPSELGGISTPEEVVQVQNQYINALRDLFERHKAKAGHPDLQLRIL